MKKLSVLLLALMLALLPAGTIFAQGDAPFVACGDMEPADCELLTEARTNMQEMTSADTLMNFDVLVAGVPGLPVSEIEFGWTQDTAYSVDPDTMDMLKNMQSDAMAEMMSDPEAMNDFILGLIGSMDIDQTLTISLSDEIAGLIEADTGFPVPSELVLDYVLVDGVIYLNLETLADIVPDIPAMLAGWIGFDLVSLVEMLLEEQGAALTGGDAADMQMAAGAGVMSSQMIQDQIEVFSDYIDVMRLDDEMDMAVFFSAIDFVSLAASPEFQDYLVEQLVASGALAQMGLNPDDLDEAAMAVSVLAPVVFNGITYEITEAIGDDAYVYSMNTLLEWDLSDLLALAGETAAGDEAMISFTTTAEYADHDAVTVAAPQGAFVLPISMLMQVVEGMQ